MKIKDRVCDVCGNSIYRHAHHTYTIRKRMWETELIGRRLDLCEDCWRKFERWRKPGRWIDTGSGQECSECHEIQYGYDSGRFYCPNCGSPMEVEHD